MTFEQICDAYRSRARSRFVAASEALIDVYADTLTADAIAELSRALADSGDKIDLPNHLAPFVDVPSTGGPSSLSTLLCPILLAASSVRVPKLSATGSIAGAIDTLRIIPGFRVHLGTDAFVVALGQAGIAHGVQTDAMCPADGVLIEVRRRKNAMRHARLAAASLLAKKLVVPGTAALFDFRLGPTGNIADDTDEARKIARLFLDVAARLSLTVATVLTNGMTFPCSALGRLESLSLLVDILRGRQPPSGLDAEHTHACVAIASHARRLAITRDDNQDLEGLIADGTAWRTFMRHLEAQGAVREDLEAALRVHTRQRAELVSAAGNGYWIPPDVGVVKGWFKRQQGGIGNAKDGKATYGASSQIGLRLLASPGERVDRGQPVVEVRSPANAKLDVDTTLLCGSVVEEQPPTDSQIFEFVGVQSPDPCR